MAWARSLQYLALSVSSPSRVPVPPLVQLWAWVALEAAAVLLAAALLSLAAAAC